MGWGVAPNAMYWLQVAVDPALGGAEGGAVPRRLEAAGADVRARAEAQGAEHPGGLHQQRVCHGPTRSAGVRAAASSRPRNVLALAGNLPTHRVNLFLSRSS